MTRGATLQFGGSPWARQAMWQDRERSAELGHRALELGVNVSVVGKTELGPWVVRVWTSRRALRFAGDDVHATVAFGLGRWAAGADDTGIRWTAGLDRLAHGHAGRSPWTLCHQRAIDQRFGHPELRRCQACWRALDRDVRAAAGAA
jgi:hypothetical protein